MKFILGIKPTIITGWGTTFHARQRVRESITGCFTCSTKFGDAYTDSLKGDPKYVYGYNIEVNIVKISIMLFIVILFLLRCLIYLILRLIKVHVHLLLSLKRNE